MPLSAATAALVLLASAPVDEAPTFPEPRGYVAHRAPGAIAVDGKLDDEGWRGIPWTDPFVDIEGGNKASLDSRPRRRWPGTMSSFISPR